MNLNDVVAEVDKFVKAAGPYVSEVVGVAETAAAVVAPEAVAGLTIGAKILTGLMQAEPVAVALYNQIVSGKPPTPAQVVQFNAAYEAIYQKTDADIKAKLAMVPLD